jgi:hypothetical protein
MGYVDVSVKRDDYVQLSDRRIRNHYNGSILWKHHLIYHGLDSFLAIAIKGLFFSNSRS